MTRKGSWVQVPHGPPTNAQVRTKNPELGGSPKGAEWADGHILVTRICYLGPHEVTKERSCRVVCTEGERAGPSRSTYLATRPLDTAGNVRRVGSPPAR